MSLLIRYAHIPFHFCFFFTFSTLSIHHYAPPLRSDRTHTCACMTITLASSNRSHLFDGHMTYDSHVFLVSPTCPLLRSDQSWALAPCGQALSITFPYAHFLVYHSYLTCLYFTFRKIIIREEPHHCLYQFPSELRFSTYALHCLALISHYFAISVCIPIWIWVSHHLYLPHYTWRQSLAPRSHPLRAP